MAFIDHARHHARPTFARPQRRDEICSVRQSLGIILGLSFAGWGLIALALRALL